MRKKVNLADKSEVISLLSQLYGVEAPKTHQDSTIDENRCWSGGSLLKFVKNDLQSSERKSENESKTG